MDLILGACRKRYGKLLTELQNDYTKGNNNYPENIIKSYNLLGQYKRDQTPAVKHRGDEGIRFRKNRVREGRGQETVKPDVLQVWREGTLQAWLPTTKKNKKDEAGTTLTTTEDGDTASLNILVGEEENNWADTDYRSEDEFSFMNVSDAGNEINAGCQWNGYCSTASQRSTWSGTRAS